MTAVEEKLRAYEKLESNRILYRPVTMDDVADIYEYASDIEVVKTLSFPIHTSLEMTKEVVQSYFLNELGKYVMIEKSTGDFLGIIDIRPTTGNKRMSFGYVLKRKHWGKGFMTEALQTMMEFGFHTLGVEAFYAEYLLENLASGRVMEKCGMKYVGIIKNGVPDTDGNLVDVGLRNITRDEYDIWQSIADEDRLAQYRYHLNGLDLQLKAILSERFELSKLVGLFKQEHNLPVFDAKREAEILKTLSDDKNIEQIYQLIFDLSKKLQ